MKTGTLLCNLFGHKFIGKSDTWGMNERLQKPEIETKWYQTPYCVRCGVDKQEDTK